MKKVSAFFYLLFVCYSASFAQKIPDGGIHKLHIDRSGSTVDAETIPVKLPAHPDPKLWYSWTAGGEIRSTQGGFSGQLLNGDYHSFYENGMPQESGAYIAGLKSGIWRNWNSNGTLFQILTYRSGLRSGGYAVYDANGKLRQTGAYDSDLLEGAVRDYPATDSTTVSWYHRGKIVPHRPLLKRLNIFKRKHRDTVNVVPKA